MDPEGGISEVLVGQCEKSMMFLYLNSRFEEGLSLQDYSCINIVFEFFKEGQLYFGIPQDASVG